MPAVAGLCGNRPDIARFLDTTVDGIIPKLMGGLAAPKQPRLVKQGVCQEVVITKDIDLRQLLPVPTFHEFDSAPFITAGILAVRDGGINLISIRRMQMLEGNKLSILIESPGLWQKYAAAEKEGKPLEVAIMFGVHPLITLTSQINSAQYGVDKFAVAQALTSENIELVSGKTVDIPVLTSSEIVLEGRMIPHQRRTEGPFGEIAGYYGPASEQPYVEVSAVTMRRNPWFETIFPGSHEHKLPNALNREVGLFLTVANAVPGVQRVHVTMPGAGRFHAIVAIRKETDGDGKTAIYAALAANKDFKHVVVVDDDVDIFDPYDVEWALATRVQASRDVVIIPGAKGSTLDPSHLWQGVTDKMGIDATVPLKDRERMARPKIPKQLDPRDYVERL